MSDIQNFVTLKSTLFHPRIEQGVLILQMNDLAKPVNSFTTESLQDLKSILDYLQSCGDRFKGLIFVSTKQNHFAAGVDIGIFDNLKTADQGTTASKELNAILLQLQCLKIMTVSAIHGSCLGGGLELSLACKWRVVADHPSTQLGLPEVQLGLIPGGGGTQRLPRVIGLSKAFDMILSGKKVDAKKGLDDNITEP